MVIPMLDPQNAKIAGQSRESTIQDLLKRTQQGDANAGQELFDNYAPALLQTIRLRLRVRLRTLFDSEDFLQHARLKLLEANLENCKSPAAFVAFMKTIAANSVREADRKYLQYEKHNLQREVHLPDERDENTDPLAREPGPLESLLATEHWQELQKGLSPIARQFSELLREGHTRKEAARLLQLTDKSAANILQTILEKHRRMKEQE